MQCKQNTITVMTGFGYRNTRSIFNIFLDGDVCVPVATFYWLLEYSTCQQQPSLDNESAY